jgi:hypothetical protein
MEPINCEVFFGFDVKHVASLAIVLFKDRGHGYFRTDVLIQLVETIIARARVDSAGVLIVTATVIYTFRTKGNIKVVATNIVAFVPSAGVPIVTIGVGAALGNFIKIGSHFCPDAVDMGSIIHV